jgi:hypothetical protein
MVSFTLWPIRPWGKSIQYTWNGKLAEHQNGLDVVATGEIFAPAGNKPRDIQTVSHYQLSYGADQKY